jgi:hypothetical protein
MQSAGGWKTTAPRRPFIGIFGLTGGLRPFHMQRNRVPQPWHDFFVEVGTRLSQPVELHCLGGFAAVACYELPRSMSDVDYVDVVPPDARSEIENLAGVESGIATRFRVYIHSVGVVTLPDNYQERLIGLCPGLFGKLGVFVLEAHDLALSKLERNNPKDREDVKCLAKTVPLKADVLKDRYHTELRPYLTNETKHDLTMKLWLEDYF